MVECEECGKTLGIFEGYRHPTMGKEHFLCSPCFDQISESIARWEEFVLSNSFDNGSSKKDLELKWKKILPSSTQIRNIFDNIEAEKEIYIQE